MALTVEGIAKAKPKPGKTGDTRKSENTTQRGSGRLLVRISRQNGSKRFYYRYAPEDGKRVLIAMDPFTVDPRPGFMTLDQARAKAAEYSALHRAVESRDVRAYLAERERKAQAAAAAEAARAERERMAAEAQRVYNLRALGAEYVATLERRGKHRSALDAANLFKNHLNKKAIADRPAKDVERGEITALLRELVEAGRGRQAGKLRSYLRAAYGLALRAEGDASAPAVLIAFRVAANPVADTRALSEFNKVRDRTLSDTELFAYWTQLANVPSEPVRGALQLALLLGGQRIAQLLRLKRADIDLSAGLLILRDPKGKRVQPRVHELPITPQAKTILQALVDRAAAIEPPSEWVFTSNGTAPVDPSTLSGVVHEIAKTMRKATESRAPFMLADIRRTAETMLAGMRVSSDVRAQIQSHGLGGVQARHYDRHDYRDEKRRALTAWARKVTTKPAERTNVIPLKRARA